MTTPEPGGRPAPGDAARGGGAPVAALGARRAHATRSPIGRIHRPTPLPPLPPTRRRRPSRWQRMTRLRRWYASVVVWARWPIVLLWIAAVAATSFYLPTLTEVGGGGFGGFTQENSQAIKSEVDSLRLFTFPVITRVLVVQHDPKGLSPAAQQAAVQRALDIDQRKPQYRDLGRAYAVPLVNVGTQSLQVGHGK